MTNSEDTTTQGDTPVLFGPGWEEWAKEHLRATGYDPDLGLEVARDAIRLVGGQLSEAEFLSRYRDGYRQEFGLDGRPSNPARAEEAREAFINKRISRRTMLKIVGAAAAGFILFPVLPRAEATETSWSVFQYGLVIDLERCDGCLDCAVACYSHNALMPWQHWIYVLPYVDDNKDGINCLPITCQHCSNPPCVKVCPVEARFKRKEDGLVLIDFDICIGCKYCEIACPYGVNYFQWGDPDRPAPAEAYWGNKDVSGLPPGNKRELHVVGRPPRSVMGKCTWCPERQGREDKKGNLTCELVCRQEVLHFGNLNDPESKPNRYLREKKKNGYMSTFRLLEQNGTGPNVIYIGQQPSARAKRVEGPVAYEDFGLVDKGQTVLGGPKPLWFSQLLGLR